MAARVEHLSAELCSPGGLRGQGQGRRRTLRGQREAGPGGCRGVIRESVGLGLRYGPCRPAVPSCAVRTTPEKASRLRQASHRPCVGFQGGNPALEPPCLHPRPRLSPHLRSPLLSLLVLIPPWLPHLVCTFQRETSSLMLPACCDIFKGTGTASPLRGQRPQEALPRKDTACKLLSGGGTENRRQEDKLWG